MAVSDPEYWPVDYFASRSQFIELATACGAQLESHPISACGPGGESLSVDVACLTAAVAGTDTGASEGIGHLVILSSGVHGVEGYLGACVQMQVLQDILENGLPADTGIVMIHAVNPWGFAHHRRVNENNVDINRNLFHPAQPLPQSHPGYASLNPVINPAQAPSKRGELQYWFNAGKLIVKNRGIAKLFKPIAEGQYDFPKGVFFGGNHTEESSELLKEIITRLSTYSERVSILDIHTGLGPSATATLIASSNRVSPEKTHDWLHTHYRHSVYVDSSASNAYDAKGTFSLWCQNTLHEKAFLYLCIEVGTVNPIKLFSALRRENQTHQNAKPRSTIYCQTKQALRDVFAPASCAWRAKSVDNAMDVFHKTIGLR